MDDKTVNRDKLIVLIEQMTTQELFILVTMANSILMEKNVLCGGND